MVNVASKKSIRILTLKLSQPMIFLVIFQSFSVFTHKNPCLMTQPSTLTVIFQSFSVFTHKNPCLMTPPSMPTVPRPSNPWPPHYESANHFLGYFSIVFNIHPRESMFNDTTIDADWFLPIRPWHPHHDSTNHFLGYF